MKMETHVQESLMNKSQIFNFVNAENYLIVLGSRK
jgi:hypothetical protein